MFLQPITHVKSKSNQATTFTFFIRNPEMNENCGMYTGAFEHFSLELDGLSRDPLIIYHIVQCRVELLKSFEFDKDLLVTF